MPVSPGSLIHCVAFAVQDPEYMNRDEKEKEEYVTIRRRQIAEMVDPLTYKQELYDMDTKEITRRVGDPEVFLDPYLYYRGVEELFQVNIFVFNPNEPLQPITGIQTFNTPGPIVEVPRCKLSHIRIPRLDRRSIIILKHWGAETDALRYPHCELIVSLGRVATQGAVRPEEEEEENKVGPVVAVERAGGGYGAAPVVTTKGTPVFERRMTELLYNVLNASFHAYVWSFPYLPITERRDRTSDELQTRSDPYSRVDWAAVFADFRIVGQQVDGYGKLRILGLEVNAKDLKAPADTAEVLPLPSTGESKWIVTVMVPPSQPLNVSELKEITTTPESVARTLLCNPSAVTRFGLWYSAIDYKWAVFVPAAITSPIEAKEAPPPPISMLPTQGHDLRDPIKEIRTVQRYANILMQLINWCWRLDKGRTPLREWWDRWVVEDRSPNMRQTVPAGPNGEPTLRPIPPTRISRRLPTVDSTLAGLNAIATWWPPYFVGGPEPPMPERKAEAQISPPKPEVKVPAVSGRPTITRRLLPLPPRPKPTLPELKRSEAARPSEVKSAGIHLYPELYQRARGYFLREEVLTAGLSVTDELVAPVTHLEGLYKWESDFRSVPKTVVFTDVEHLNGWLTHQSRRGITNTSINPILYNMNEGMASAENSQPFIYRESTSGKIYLIQNVRGGEIARAIKVALTWYYHGLNPGYSTEPDPEQMTLESIPHVIYSISTSQIVAPYEINTGGHDVFMQFLRYPQSGLYAAMLPIL